MTNIALAAFRTTYKTMLSQSMFKITMDQDDIVFITIYEKVYI